MAGDAAILPQGAGYGVVVGIGFFFAIFMAGISWLQVRSPSALARYCVPLLPPFSHTAHPQNRYTSYSTKGSEEFNTASRSVKTGMVASAVVSAWTWAATLLQSSTVAYQYGISGPFWVSFVCPRDFVCKSNKAN